MLTIVTTASLRSCRVRTDRLPEVRTRVRQHRVQRGDHRLLQRVQEAAQVVDETPIALEAAMMPNSCWMETISTRDLLICCAMSLQLCGSYWSISSAPARIAVGRPSSLIAAMRVQLSRPLAATASLRSRVKVAMPQARGG